MEIEAKIYGIERTGTNWLYLLMNSNYDVELHAGNGVGRKHEAYYADKKIGREIHAIIISKHPLVWIPSIHRFRHRGSLFQCIGHESQIWNNLYKKHVDLKLKDKKKVFVKYEDLLRNPEKECSRIAKIIGCPRKTDEFYVPRKKMSKSNTETKDDFNKSYYLDHKYRGEYDDRVMEKMRNSFNLGIMKAIGYEW